MGLRSRRRGAFVTRRAQRHLAGVLKGVQDAVPRILVRLLCCVTPLHCPHSYIAQPNGRSRVAGGPAAGGGQREWGAFCDGEHCVCVGREACGGQSVAAQRRGDAAGSTTAPFSHTRNRPERPPASTHAAALPARMTSTSTSATGRRGCGPCEREGGAVRTRARARPLPRHRHARPACSQQSVTQRHPCAGAGSRPEADQPRPRAPAPAPPRPFNPLLRLSRGVALH